MRVTVEEFLANLETEGRPLELTAWQRDVLEAFFEDREMVMIIKPRRSGLTALQKELMAWYEAEVRRVIP